MPAFVNWLLRLIVTNPICMRLVQGGSKRVRHLYIRAGYLGVMIVFLLFILVQGVAGTGLSVRELASAGANMFQWVSYLQVGLICLLTPVFMAGAIAQEANPKTWDIMLTTPLNNLQIVLGNLFGRLFFIIALLVSSLPLFIVTQVFGGVPGESIFASYAIAGTSSLLVASIAITLSVTRTAGRRAVFIFYVAVVMYLFVTYLIDLLLREPIGAGTSKYLTTAVTPLNPFLALEVLLQSNTYVPHDLTGLSVSWLTRVWFAQPIGTFCWLCAGISFVLILFSTVRVRVIGAKVGQVPWYRRMLKLGARDSLERPARHVGANPIAWRESTARGKTLTAILARWTFAAAGIAVAFVLLGLYHQGTFAPDELQMAVVAVVTAEIVIITLAAVNMSATAVSKEREDGSLDIILTTPIQPGPYLAGKLRGLIQYLLPMMLVPVTTMIILAVYVMADGFGVEQGVTINPPNPGGTGNFENIPLVLPEGAIALPIMLAPFLAFCVMVGLQWSIKSKGTIGSVIAAFGVLAAVIGVLTICAFPAGQNLSVIGSAFTAFSPVNIVLAIVFPANFIHSALAQEVGAARVSLIVGAFIAAGVYAAIVYGMHTNMKRTFMMTVRRLAGTT